MAENVPKYKSVPPSKVEKPPVERGGFKGDPRPLRGVFSNKDELSESGKERRYRSSPTTQKYFAESKRQELKSSIRGSAITALRGGSKKAASQVFQSVASTAIRFGSDKAFYWLVGLIVPTFGLSIIGLNLLLVISRIRKAMKMWQKIVIVLLDIAILLLILIVLLTTLIYFCNVTIPLGSKIAKGLGYVTSNKYLTFCQYFDIADISKGAQSTTSGSVQGATDFRRATLPAVDFLPRGR